LIVVCIVVAVAIAVAYVVVVVIIAIVIAIVVAVTISSPLPCLFDLLYFRCHRCCHRRHLVACTTIMRQHVTIYASRHNTDTTSGEPTRCNVADMVCVMSATWRRHVGVSVVLGGENPRHDANITSQDFYNLKAEANHSNNHGNQN
jgi:hypothetical protein